MRRFLLTTAAVSFVAALALPAAAQAQQGRRHVAVTHAVAAPPLTVNRRSWLDMGTAAAVGTQDSYLSANTTLHQPIYASFAQDKFGQSTLPGQFSLPFGENPRGTESGGIFFDE